MRYKKMSISLSKPLCDFVEEYQATYHCDSRSEVISHGLRMLQQLRLENCYKEANNEISEEFETTTFDGLENETW